MTDRLDDYLAPGGEPTIGKLTQLIAEEQTDVQTEV
jgi:hypothetical protein